MQYMIIRRADAQSETARLPAAESDLLFAALKPSSSAVRLSLRDGEATVTRGPFPDPREMIAGFTVIDVPTRADALEWLKRWPVSDAPVTLELRESGCPDGCAQIMSASRAVDDSKRFAILLRSSRALDDEVPVAPDKLDALNAHNAAEAQAGVLLAADGLRTSARGVRVKVSKGAFSVIDGPFTEIKEMIAGFWMIRAASMEDAIAWARCNPYPTGPEVEVEIRELFKASENIDAFTPDLQAAEQRIRAEQLEAGMRAHFTA